MYEINKSAEIAILNDAVRQSLVSVLARKHLAAINCRFQVMMTATLKNTIQDKVGLLKAIAEFDEFNEDNDPYGEHDYFRFKFEDEWVIGKFDYYAPDMEHGSEDATNLTNTVRVLTLMMPIDY